MGTRTKKVFPADRPEMRLLRIFLAFVPLLITGCQIIHVAQCSLPDNPTNREAATNIVASVAIKHEFVGHPERLVPDALLASYNYLGDSPKHPIHLDVYTDAGTVTASLTQTTNKKEPTERFLSAQHDLVHGFKEKFGGAVEINIYHDEEMPP